MDERIYLKDLLEFLRYRLKLSFYGLLVFFLWFFGSESRQAMRNIGVIVGLFGFIGVILAVGSIFETVRDYIIISIAAFVGILVVSAYILGSLKMILFFGARSELGFKKVESILSNGRKKKETYSRLVEIYQPLIERVNQKLGKKLFSLDGKHAVATAPVDNIELSQIFNPIIDDSFRSLEKFCINASSRQDYFKRKRDMAPERWKDMELGDNYCLTKIDYDGERIFLNVGIATYGNIMRSSDCLITELELFSGIEGNKRLPPKLMLKCLPWRLRIHGSDSDGPEDIFLLPTNRAAGIGVSALTIFREQDDSFKFLVGRRGDKVATYPGVLQTIPAGMCNVKRAPLDEYLEYAIKSEFFEEAFNDTDLEMDRGDRWQNMVEERSKGEHSPFNGKYGTKIYLTGILFDLVNLRPEVCSLVLIDSKNYKKCIVDRNFDDEFDRDPSTKEVELNWEFNDSIFFERIANYTFIEGDVSQSVAGNFALGKRKIEILGISY